MDKDKRDEVLNAIADFIIRVAKEKAPSDKELEVLPEVAKAFAEMVF